MIGRAAIQYSAVLYNAILYNGWQYNAILYNTMPPLLFDLVYYYDNSIKHIAILCNTMQYDWTGHNTIQCSAIQCYTIQWMAIQCYIIQYNATWRSVSYVKIFVGIFNRS